MWIMSTYGFFSVIRKTKNEYQVRARERYDLVMLIRAVRKDGKYFRPNIIRTEKADYLYRIVLTPGEYNRVFRALHRSIDYSNFKSAVHATEGQSHKYSFYHRIWEIMMELQPVGLYKRLMYPRRDSVRNDAERDFFGTRHDGMQMDWDLLNEEEFIERTNHE